MKYTVETTIKKPREVVVALFEDRNKINEWQDGFISMEHISGEPGKSGAKSKMKYKMGNKEVEMIETITKANTPSEFFGTYESKGVFNKVDNYFEVVDENTTKWKIDTEFQFSGFAMKLMALVMPGVFKKQTMKVMEDFKKMVEKN